MLIKFKTPDPRAGMTARMDSSRGWQFINAGLAVRLNEDGTDQDGAALRAELDAALDHLPGDNIDPDNVVRAMRSHFGALFTDADEARVRDLVWAPAAQPPAPEPADEVAVAAAAPAPSDATPAAPPEPAKPARSRK